MIRLPYHLKYWIMKVLIIEDELLTAEDLAGILVKMPEGISVIKILCSVKEAVEYLRSPADIDLIFCDIHLGDGYSFEIFKQVQISTPVIFCTAFNKYALEAFDYNGIGYVVKPFTRKSISDAVAKFTSLKTGIAKKQTNIAPLLETIQSYQAENNRPSSILVNWKHKIIPVKIADIALFSIEHKCTRLITKDNNDYSITYTLEELEQMCGSNFYRANRQYLIHKNYVEEVSYYAARKLFVKLAIKGDFDITIPKVKVPEFLSWLKY